MALTPIRKTLKLSISMEPVEFSQPPVVRFSAGVTLLLGQKCRIEPIQALDDAESLEKAGGQAGTGNAAFKQTWRIPLQVVSCN